MNSLIIYIDASPNKEKWQMLHSVVFENFDNLTFVYKKQPGAKDGFLNPLECEIKTLKFLIEEILPLVDSKGYLKNFSKIIIKTDSNEICRVWNKKNYFPERIKFSDWLSKISEKKTFHNLELEIEYISREINIAHQTFKKINDYYVMKYVKDGIKFTNSEAFKITITKGEVGNLFKNAIDIQNSLLNEKKFRNYEEFEDFYIKIIKNNGKLKHLENLLKKMKKNQ